MIFRLHNLFRRLPAALSRLLLLFLLELRSLALSGVLWTAMIAAGSSLTAYTLASSSRLIHPLALSFGVGLVVFGGLSLAHAWKRDRSSR